MPVMEEEQHYDAFNMDNDYEGLVEIDGEFLYREKRKKRLQTRDEQLYGYQSSDDEDGGGGRRGGGGKRGKADYSKPVGFVSSGVFVQQPDEPDKASGSNSKGSSGSGSKPPQQQQQQQQQQQRPGSADSSGAGAGAGLGFGAAGAGAGLGFSSASSQGRAGLGSSSGGGLGFAGGGGGLGFKSGGLQTRADGPAADAPPRAGLGSSSSGGGGGLGSSGWQAAAKHQQQQQDDDDADLGFDDEEAAVLPTAFGRRIKAAAEKKQQQRAAQQKASADAAAARSADPKFASFEAHTKGIGMKLLEKMGFQPGKGLGKQKQGIAKPIEARLRPKGMGMGFGEYKEPKLEVAPKQAAAQAEADAAELQQELADATAKAQAPLWKKKAAPARQRRTYKTAEEVLEAAAAQPLAAQPILDMRGPQTRLLTDMDQINTAADGAAGADGGPPMPELAHNMGLLVSLTEAQLRRMDASLQHQQDTAALLATEKERLEKELVAAAAAAQRLAALTSDLESVQQQTALPLPALQQAYEAMARSYPEEYVLYNIAAAALCQVLPLLGQLLRGWQPLEQPTLGAAQFKAWRGLLEGEAARQAVLSASWEEAGDPYAELVLQLVMPPIRSAITHWEPRQPEPLLAWFDAWNPLLPRGASQQLLQGLVMPRLAAAVEAWDPTRETQPIHAWLHPWLPYLAAELQGVYPTIRHRLSRALTAWHASDASARVLLAPWQSVFDAADWEALLQRSIMPKLAQSLQTELVLNPLVPQLDPFYWALAWSGLMPTGSLAALLEAAFFPAWHSLLHTWLSAAPNYDEVTRWYLQWKGLFPQDLLDHPRVRAGFATALNLMNSAADGQPLPAAAAAAAPAAGPVPSWRAEMAAGAAEPAAAGAGARGGYGAAAAAAEPSFRDLVAQYAQEQGFEFLPRAGRLHDGLPVYSFGGVSCVVDAAHSLIRAQLRDRGWAPVTLEKLREEAAGRQQQRRV